MGLVDISKIDGNMSAKTKIDRSGFDFYSVDDAPFRIYGVKKIDGKYRRLTEEVAKTVNFKVHLLHANTAGGRIRFVSDSKRLAFIVKGEFGMPGENLAYLNCASLDVYANGSYYGIARGGTNYPVTYYESVVSNEAFAKGERLYTVYMPCYGEAHEIFIGIEKGASLKVAPDYTYEKPVVFYGSSITQGACASRGGLAYEAILEREFDFDYLNLGFSGNANGEQSMARYIAGLDMCAFVLDYDYNARNPRELLETHEPFYKTVREQNPNLPIIMISMPKYDLTEEDLERYKIIKATYDNAVASGDENVYLIFGKDLLFGVGSEGLSDGIHPNDLGFRYMSRGIAEKLRLALKL